MTTSSGLGLLRVKLLSLGVLYLRPFERLRFRPASKLLNKNGVTGTVEAKPELTTVWQVRIRCFSGCSVSQAGWSLIIGTHGGVLSSSRPVKGFVLKAFLPLLRKPCPLQLVNEMA
jgi:hypothetical protein